MTPGDARTPGEVVREALKRLASKIGASPSRLDLNNHDALCESEYIVLGSTLCDCRDRNEGVREALTALTALERQVEGTRAALVEEERSANELEARAEAAEREVDDARKALGEYSKHEIGQTLTGGIKNLRQILLLAKDAKEAAEREREEARKALTWYPFGGLDGLLDELAASLRAHGGECTNPESCGPLGCLLAKVYHARKAVSWLT